MTYRLAEANEPLIIVMNETCRGSSDGHSIKQFIKGSVYYANLIHSHKNDEDFIGDTLARDFLSRGKAKPFKMEKIDCSQILLDCLNLDAFSKIIGDL